MASPIRPKPSGARFLQKRRDARLRFLAAAGDRRHQRFHHIAGSAVLFGDARQRLNNAEVGEPGVLGDLAGEIERLGEALAFADQIMREAERLAFFRRQHMAGQHHVHHARRADQARYAHRAAAADEDAAHAFRQCIERRALGDAHMRGCRKLKAAADDGAMQHGDNRHLAEFHLVEDAMPRTRVAHAVFDAVDAQFGQVEAGGEMIAVAVQHDALHVFRQRVEQRFQTEHGFVVERIALLRAVELDDEQVVALLGRKRGRQFRQRARAGRFLGHGLRGHWLHGNLLVHKRRYLGWHRSPVGSRLALCQSNSPAGRPDNSEWTRELTTPDVSRPDISRDARSQRPCPRDCHPTRYALTRHGHGRRIRSAPG